jgi:uncharacterized protein (DUF433 family)
MAIRIHNIVPGDESDAHDEPHIADSRVSVWFVHQRVEEAGLAPETVAEQHDLDIADVYAALAYYHNNPETMGTIERERAAALDEAERRTTIDPPDET